MAQLTLIQLYVTYMAYYRSTGSPAPPVTDGHLYYIRLRTAFGPMYKLGVTSASSIEERFAYKENGDERLLDRQFLFAFREDAFFAEQRLHNHFSNKRAFGRYASNPALPLYQNGQSEIYVDDILRLDRSYSKEQGDKTRAQLRAAHVHCVAADPWWWRPAILALGVPLRLVVVSVAVLVRSLERVADAVFKVPPSKRGALFGGAAKQEQSVGEQQDRVETTRLLDWVRANATERAFAPVVTTIVKPTAATLAEQIVGTGTAAHAIVSNSPAHPATKETKQCVGVSSISTRPRLEDIVQQVSSYPGNAWLNLARDLRRTMPLTTDDATVRFAAVYGLVTACVKLYQDKMFKLEDFTEMTHGLRAGNELASVEWTAALAQFDELAKRYNLMVSAGEAEALVDSFLPTYQREKPDEMSIEEFGIQREARRVQLMAKRMRATCTQR